MHLKQLKYNTLFIKVILMANKQKKNYTVIIKFNNRITIFSIQGVSFELPSKLRKNIVCSFYTPSDDVIVSNFDNSTNFIIKMYFRR